MTDGGWGDSSDFELPPARTTLDGTADPQAAAEIELVEGQLVAETAPAVVPLHTVTTPSGNPVAGCIRLDLPVEVLKSAVTLVDTEVTRLQGLVDAGSRGGVTNKLAQIYEERILRARFFTTEARAMLLRDDLSE